MLEFLGFPVLRTENGAFFSPRIPRTPSAGNPGNQADFSPWEQGMVQIFNAMILEFQEFLEFPAL